MLDTKNTITRRCKICDTSIVIQQNGRIPKLGSNSKTELKKTNLQIFFTINDRKEGGQKMFCYCGTLLWIPINLEEKIRVLLHHG